MCGRYTLCAVGKETALPFPEAFAASAGEICPGAAAPVLTKYGLEILRWGFPKTRETGLIINARCESALDKPLFQRAFSSGRCAVPAAAFFEWRGKKRYRFTLPDASCLYMAGLCAGFSDTRRFVVLTTGANDSVAAVHDRMPLLLPEDALQRWFCDAAFAAGQLCCTPPPLRCDPPAPQGSAQLALFG